MAFHELWDQKFELVPGKWVFIPSTESRIRGEYIASEIKRKWQAPFYFYHCRQGGHVEALKKHMASRYFCCIDIKSFFASINRSRVTRVLKKHFGYVIAREFSRDSVILLNENDSKKYILPFGFLQSPIIASICLDESALGRRLCKLASSYNFIVSVYVDDIILSCNDIDLLRKEFENIIIATNRSGWKISTEKTYAPSEQILAFNIQMSHGYLGILPERMNLFSTAYQKAESDHQKEGILRYIRSINPNQTVLL